MSDELIRQILENQREHLIKEAEAFNRSPVKKVEDMNEEEEADEIVRRLATPPADPDAFRKIVIPMIRRIMPTMIAQEIVGVQPMQEVKGLNTIFNKDKE